MKLVFHGKRIEGLLTVLPANERLFVDEMDQFDFPRTRSLKLKEVMGYDRHRIVDGDVCVSDLAVAGFEHLFAHGLLDRDGFDALIVVTQTPDHLMPATSFVIQGRLGLKPVLPTLSKSAACSGQSCCSAALPLSGRSARPTLAGLSHRMVVCAQGRRCPAVSP